ncbi:MAG TPA: hypothetical protein VFS05_02970 [Gemmatimonadaceae bacterium]|nr:hypothetical protein [Gemmatimonadaceae bacterium]
MRVPSPLLRSLLAPATVLAIAALSACAEPEAAPPRAVRQQAAALVTVVDDVRDLGAPAGCCSEALMVSDSGSQVVGRWTRGLFHWSEGNGFTDLRVAGAPVGVTAAGVVAGNLDAPAARRAFRWRRAAGLELLRTLGGAESRAFAVAESGDVLGTSTTADGAVHIVRWPAAGGVEDLGALAAPGVEARVTAMSRRGDAVGWWSAAGAPDSARRAFRWSRATGMRELGAYGGGGDGVPAGALVTALAVGDDGTVFGAIGTRVRRLFAWTEAGGHQLLPLLCGAEDSLAGVSSWGAMYGAGRDSCASRWSPGGSAERHALAPDPLGVRDSVLYALFSSSEARGVNRRGDVVGWGELRVGGGGGGERRAFAWTADGGLRDLGTLGGARSAASAIGSDRVVVGWAETADGARRAVRWVIATRPGPAATCHGVPATIVIADPGMLTRGTPGRDVIVGTAGPDVINGGDGDDLICGGGGDDEIDGGPGDDVIHGGAGDDRIFGNAGDDRLHGGDGDDLLSGGPGRDDLLGGRGSDRCNDPEGGAFRECERTAATNP